MDSPHVLFLSGSAAYARWFVVRRSPKSTVIQPPYDFFIAGSATPELEPPLNFEGWNLFGCWCLGSNGSGAEEQTTPRSFSSLVATLFDVPRQLTGRALIPLPIIRASLEGCDYSMFLRPNASDFSCSTFFIFPSRELRLV